MDDLRNTINGFIPVMAVIVTLGVLRSLLTFDVEKQLWRKLIDWEYQYFLQERDRKAAVEARGATIRSGDSSRLTGKRFTTLCGKAS